MMAFNVVVVLASGLRQADACVIANRYCIQYSLTLRMVDSLEEYL